MKKIQIYVNGKYAYTTEKFNTIKNAIASLEIKKEVLVKSIPDYVIKLKDGDKITGKIV